MRSFISAILAAVALLAVSLPAGAGDVAIVMVDMTAAGNGKWDVDVTLRHEDTGWEHYADAWQIVDAQGKLLAKRVLFHPHEHEQPFTRSLSDVAIPTGTGVVFIEAHDKVHGWSKQRVRVDLNTASGDRYRVGR